MSRPDWCHLSVSRQFVAQARFDPGEGQSILDKLPGQGTEFEVPIEPPHGFVQVALTMLFEAKRMMAIVDAALGVAAERVDPANCRGTCRLASLGELDGVRMPEFREHSEAIPAIAADIAPRFQADRGSVSNRRIGKARHSGRDNHQGHVVLRGGYRNHKLHVVLRSAFGHAAGELAAQVGVVESDEFRKAPGISRILDAFQHPMLEPPGCSVAHVQMPHQPRRQIGLRLHRHVDSQEPLGQRQTAMRKLRVHANTCLLAAPSALAIEHNSASRILRIRALAQRANESTNQTLVHRRRLACFLGPRRLRERRLRQALLELQSIHGHHTLRRGLDGDEAEATQSDSVRLLRDDANKESERVFASLGACVALMRPAL